MTAFRPGVSQAAKSGRLANHPPEPIRAASVNDRCGQLPTDRDGRSGSGSAQKAANRLTRSQITGPSRGAARQAEIAQLLQRFEGEANVRYRTIIGRSPS